MPDLGMTFEQVWTAGGREFAEAHHIIPLSRLQGSIERTPEHLVTVCANCHRMLHHMSGQPGDLSILRKIVKGIKGNRLMG